MVVPYEMLGWRFKESEAPMCGFGGNKKKAMKKIT
jgi:hypothetical protein